MKYPISPYVQFRIALKHLVKKNWKKKQGELAKKAGITAGHLSDILRGAKDAGHKTQVALAEACGLEYPNILALGRNLHMAEKMERELLTSQIAEPVADYQQEIIDKAVKILESDTSYSSALKTNINAFYEALKTREKLENMEKRIAALENKTKLKNEETSS